MNSVKYVQLEPDAFLSDLDFQIMSDRQRGIYVSIILYLYRNGGKIKHCSSTAQALLKLCNSDPQTFDSDWQAIKHKFQCTKTEIRHKRVSLELEKSQRYFENKRKAGQKGGLSDKSSTAQALLKQCLSTGQAQVKLNQINSKSIDIDNNNNSKKGMRNCKERGIDKNSFVAFELPLQKLCLRTIGEIEKILPVRTQREATTFANILRHVKAYCLDGRTDRAESIFQDVASLAKEAAKSNCTNKKGFFVSLVKKRYGFNNHGSGK